MSKRNIFFLLFISVLPVMFSNSYHSELLGRPEEKVVYLNKTGEITDNFSDEEYNYFWHIDDICCDHEGNIYVSDSGWNKIFKFDSEGKYITSFGREGQGPGEFLGMPGRTGLKISFGNDENIYITDTGNARLSVFSKGGKFIKQFSLPPRLYDKAQANSQGDIYLLSTNGEDLINRYDKDFRLKEGLFKRKLHFNYPFYKDKGGSSKYIDDHSIRKMIAPDDHIIVLSNISLTIFHFDEKNKLLNKFFINNDTFVRDFKDRLKKIITRRGFIGPFRTCLDKNGIIYLFYRNQSMQKDEVYRYKIDGTFLDNLRFPENTRRISCVDYSGSIYTIIDETRIGIYRAKNH